MTVYYCGELDNDEWEYVKMIEDSSQIMILDISSFVKVYEFQTKHLSNYEVNIDFILPSIFEMLSVKNGFEEKLDRCISDLMLTAMDSYRPSYYDELRMMASNEIRHWRADEDSEEECNDPTADLITIELFSNAIKYLGERIYEQIADVAYKNNYLAYNIYSYENGIITLLLNYVPALGSTGISKPTAKVAELSINSVLSRYGKEIEFK